MAKLFIYLSAYFLLVQHTFGQVKPLNNYIGKPKALSEQKSVAAPVPNYFVSTSSSSVSILPNEISFIRSTGDAGDNTALGFNALNNDSGNKGNTAIGYSSLNASTTSTFNTALGAYALNLVQTKGHNTAIGYRALANTIDGGLLLEGTKNTAVGHNALSNNTTGYFNHAFGSEALINNQTGLSNVGIGTSTLFSNISGGLNVAIGHLAGYGKTGNYNVAIGGNTLQADGFSSNNVAIGRSSQFSNTTGSSNVSIGHEALKTNSAGSGNIALGYKAGINETGSNKLYIGNSSTNTFLYGDLSTGQVGFNVTYPGNFFQMHNPNATNTYLHLTNLTSGTTINDGLEIGVTSNNATTYFYQNEASNIEIATNDGASYLRLATGISTKFGVGRTATTNALEVQGEASKTTAGSFIANSDARLKTHITNLNSEKILSKVLQMQGVNYEWNDTNSGYERPKGVQTGFIAQDLEKIWPEKIKRDANGYLMTAYGDYDPMFVESIKALYQKIQHLEKENKSLHNDKQELSARMNKLEELIYGESMHLKNNLKLEK